MGGNGNDGYGNDIYTTGRSKSQPNDGMTRKRLNQDMNLNEHNIDMYSTFLMCCVIIITASMVMTAKSVLST